ncbi:hypothetical protein GCM10009853_032210 [Glycomyces scopariae]
MPHPDDPAPTRRLQHVVFGHEGQSTPAEVFLRRAIWFSAAALAFLLAVAALVVVMVLGPLLWLIAVLVPTAGAGLVCATIALRRHRPSRRSVGGSLGDLLLGHP